MTSRIFFQPTNVCWLILSLPRVINFKFPLQIHHVDRAALEHRDLYCYSLFLLAYYACSTIFSINYPCIHYGEHLLHSVNWKCQVKKPKTCEIRRSPGDTEDKEEWSTSNFPCSLASNITSRNMENFAFHSLLRWKMIMLSIPTTPLIHFSLNILSLGVKGRISERFRGLSVPFTSNRWQKCAKSPHRSPSLSSDAQKLAVASSGLIVRCAER